MRKKLKGGMETIIAIVIVTGIIVALLLSVVVPMATEGDKLIGTTTNKMVENQERIGPTYSGNK